MKKNQSGFSAVEVLVVIVIVGLLGLVGWYVWQKNDTTTTSPQDSTASTEANDVQSDTGELDVHDAGAITYRDDGVVVFYPNGLIDKEDKKELEEKVLNPMIDYSPNTYISVTVDPYLPQIYTDGNSDDKYIVTTIGKKDKGETGSFLIGHKKDGINWWTPVCLDSCTFSQSYKDTYPEVVKSLGQQ